MQEQGKDRDISLEIVMTLNPEPYCLTAAAQDETSWKLLNSATACKLLIKSFQIKSISFDR